MVKDVELRDVGLRIRLLGPMTVGRGGRALALPASRKARALFAYLALAPRPAARSQLCELLWEDGAGDPRGELRWCLSKLRKVLDRPGRARVLAGEDSVALDLSDCFVDALQVARATEAGVGALAVEPLRELAALFEGDFLEGLEIERSPAFGGWLTAQRRRFRGRHTALLEQLVKSAPDEEAFGHLEKWVQLAPFDPRVHELLLAVLARQGRMREGEEHLAAAARQFEAEGLDSSPLVQAWREVRPQVQAATETRAVQPAGQRRASIAVMPFSDPSGAHGGPAEALAHDVITRLAKLRSLFVIAQGSVFALHERRIGPEEAGRILNVDYVVSGSVQRRGGQLTVAVDLAETRSARVVWAEVFNHRPDDAFLVLEEIGNRIVASIAGEIEAVERNRAMLRPPSSLDAWEAYHRGLWHMYRFSKAENERAAHFFEMAVRLDPAFSRAHAGLSFTHFQNAFQGWGRRAAAADRTFEAAEQGLMADDRDPAAHWAMGRALWLRGRHDDSVAELDKAIDLSPNFALAHYNLAFVHSTAGDARTAIAAADYSRNLSPFDPMLFGMLGARAMAHVRLGEFGQASEWAVRAASRPNAFPHIRAIAAYSLALAGSLDEARRYAAAVRGALPRYGFADFLDAFRFDAGGAAAFRRGAKLVGME